METLDASRARAGRGGRLEAVDVLVCATQVPHMRGGLEMLVEGLIKGLRDAGHRAEAVRVPAAWDRGRVLDAAAAWRMIPLEADLVIPVNFPAYYARHPNKVLWLAHQHRAAYDGLGQPWSDFDLSDESLASQRQLIDWDVAALSEAKARFTISQVVSDRMAKFCGLDSTPIYHPPPLAPLLAPSRLGSSIVSISRLEQNKRPDLFIDALAELDQPIPAVLAGTGSLADDLKAKAAANVSGPVSFPGFVSDEVSAAMFHDCRAVFYAPFDEDYGYVTLEAFLAGKPVVTTTDAGGVLEWVEDGVTGLVVEPEPTAVANAFARLASDSELAERLGRAGRTRVENLRWADVVSQLLSAAV